MRRNKRRNAPKHLIPTLLSGLVVLATISGLGYLVMSQQGQALPDKYGCYKEAPRGQYVHVLVDASLPRFSEAQERSAYRYLKNTYDTLRFGNKLLVYTTENDRAASISKARFYVCGAASSPEELEAINAVTATEDYLAKLRERGYSKRFLPELDKVMAKDLPDERMPLSSAILEQIADISRSKSFKRGDKLVVISDLIQNSDTSQFCAVKNAMPAFSSYQNWEPYQTRLKPKHLQAIKVDVLMLQRAEYGKYCKGESEVRAFWSDYFNANGAEANFIRLRMRG